MPVTVHGKLIHRVLLQVLKDTSLVRGSQKASARPLYDRLGLMLGRSADASSRTDHSFNKVFLQAAVLKKQHPLSALIAAGTPKDREVRSIFTHLLHSFKHCVRNAAGSGEALSVDRRFLVVLFHRSDLDLPGIKKRDHLTVCHGIIRVILDILVHRLALLGDAGADEDRYAVRIL